VTADRYNPLLDVIDQLTLPHIEHMRQVADDDTFIGLHTVEHPALLDQLKAAINPSSNTAAGSASLKSTRNLIDSTAMFEYGKMSAAIGDWCRTWDAPVTRDPIVDLRQWYIAYSRGSDDPQWYVRELNRWAGLIRNMVTNDVARIPQRIPCPVCKAVTFTNDDGEVVPFPLLVEYRKPESVSDRIHPKITCRNPDCGAEWDGFEAIAEMGEEVTGIKVEIPLNN